MNEELSLKDLLLRLYEFWKELWRNWYLIALIIIPFLAFQLYKHYTTVTKYQAELSFMINDDEGGSSAGLSSLLGQFGFGGKKTEYNLDKMLELMRSRKITERVLFEKRSINGQEDFLGNHLIRNLDSLKMWAEKRMFGNVPELKGFLFSNSKLENFNRLENSALKTLHGKILGDEKTPGIISGEYKDETGIIKISGATTSEELSADLVNTYYDKLSEYYINKAIEKQRATFELVKAKMDSLSTETALAEAAWARHKDANRGIFTMKDELKGQQLFKEVEKLNEMYIEAVKNFEIADFSLKNSTPVIQVIDLPLPPLSPRGSSLLIRLIKGLAFGGFVGVAFVVGRKVFRDIMNE
jgi:uncharacterized protein involved in exopolysaccharide biosynthesis